MYQSKVHPAQVCNTLSIEQIQRLWENTIEVCKIAVEVNADHNLFPKHWLFKYRWGKSHARKKQKAAKEEEDVDSEEDIPEANLGKTMTTKDGRGLNIEWITCGGRTSAFVVDEQILPVLPATKDIQEEIKEEVDEQKPIKVKRTAVVDVEESAPQRKLRSRGKVTRNSNP